jgi:hypothetical protein
MAGAWSIWFSSSVPKQAIELVVIDAPKNKSLASNIT